MEIWSALVIVLFVLNLLLATVLIFIERRDATATWAWLLVLYFIPFLGFLIYLILGQNLTRRRLFEWEGIKKIGIEDLIREQKAHLHDSNFPFENPLIHQYRDLIYMHLMNNDAVLTENNKVDIITSGQEKFDRLLQDIERAQAFIHIQYYIFRNDQIGRKIIEALTRKAKQGVEIRFLYDELGSRKLHRRHLRELEQAGGEIGVFFPSRLAIINLRLNYRNHRKLVNIDGKIGYVGGFNVGDEHLGKSKKIRALARYAFAYYRLCYPFDSNKVYFGLEPGREALFYQL